jgi:Carboxypeptidase regulatory-like domain
MGSCRKLLNFLTLFCFVLLFLGSQSLSVFADINGEIQGTVLDSTGAAVPDAKITVKSLSTGATRTLVANQAGEFASPQLDIGSYQVSVEKDGFSTFSQTVVVRSGETTRIEAQLQIGQVANVVSVEESALPTVDVATAQISDSFNSEEVLALPNLARDPVVYATLSPGTVPVSVNNPFLGAGSFNSNGSRGRANNITLDGVTATDVSVTGESGAAFVQDSVAEVKIITNNFDAEFGRNSGSQVQILTKSGTNSYHGTAYEYFQNSGLGDARGYFTPEGGAVPKFVQNQGGVTFGAPIIKDHTFFYGSWEVDRTAGAGQAVIANVLTPAQVAGITDPTSLALFKADGSPTSPTGSLSESSANTSHGDIWTLRVDQVLRGGKDTLFVKYGQAPATTVSPGLTFISTNLPGFGASVSAEPRDVTIGFTSVLTSNLINSFHFGFGRANPEFPVNSPFTPGPQIIFGDGTSSFGESDIIPQGRVQNTFQYTDTVSWTKGKHTFKFGADINRYQAPSTFPAEALGVAVYADVAAFQTGTPEEWAQILGPTDRHNFALDAFGFVEDDIRLTRTLTLNLGFRWESSGGVSEGSNLLSNLDPNNHTPIGALGLGPLGGVDLGGTAFNRNYNPAPRLGFAWNPGTGKLVVRGGYGIAYDFIYQNPITNLRFAPPFTSAITVTSFTGGNSIANLVAGTSPAQTAALANLGTFSPTVSDFGGFDPVDQNLKNPRNQQWDFGVEYQLPFALVMKVTYVGSHSDRLQVSEPINLVNPADIPAAPTSLADQTARQQQFVNAALSEVGGNPVTPNGLNDLIDQRFDNVTQVQSTGTSTYNSLQVEGIRRFKNGLTFDANYTWAHSIDDISDALGVLINDSAVPLDASKPISFQRSNSEFDIRNRFVLSYTYEIPFAKGFHGWRKYVLDGWSQSGIFSAQSGLPVTVLAAPITLCSGGGGASLANCAAAGGSPVSIDDLLLNGTNNGGTIANTPVNGNATALHPVPFFSSYVVPSTLPVSEPLLEQEGSSGRNQLRLAGLTDYDAAFSKSFHFTESKYFQLRWEAFNFLNHPNFAGYINTFGSSQFNTYTSTATNARQFQLSGRFFF